MWSRMQHLLVYAWLLSAITGCAQRPVAVEVRDGAGDVRSEAADITSVRIERSRSALTIMWSLATRPTRPKNSHITWGLSIGIGGHGRYDVLATWFPPRATQGALAKARLVGRLGYARESREVSLRSPRVGARSVTIRVPLRLVPLIRRASFTWIAFTETVNGAQDSLPDDADKRRATESFPA
jgi:hypothetical protein